MESVKATKQQRINKLAENLGVIISTGKGIKIINILSNINSNISHIREKMLNAKSRIEYHHLRLKWEALKEEQIKMVNRLINLVNQRESEGVDNG